MRMPGSVDELRGLRAARWIRESTAGQQDRYGPDAQREQQDRAIERYGLVDSGLAWSVAHSGRTIAGTADFAAMIAAAGAGYDVLVVGYVSRFARDLRTAVNARHELHAAGAAVLFADERLLSSDEEAWESWAREAVEAEAYSRRLGKRIREGYAAKRRRLADPGGRPPFGMRRNADKLLEPDPERYNVVCSVFELAAARLTDRDVAARTGVSLYTVRGMLRNPLYAGRLPDGSSTRFAALVEPALWNEVQDVRERRSRRDGRPAIRRPYALSMLHCAGCGRRLIGDTGRYRHTDACSAFTAAAAPTRRTPRGRHRVLEGRSYAAAAYERLVREVLGRVALGADVIAEVVADTRAPEPDRLALLRVDRERDAAVVRYRRDRDTGELAATMARLDVDEQRARDAQAPQALEPAEVVAYLRDLPAVWDAAPSSRRALAEALFERIEVLGLRSMRIQPTPAAAARGLGGAFRAGGAGYGRGERKRAPANRLIMRVQPGLATRVTVEVPAAARPRIVERTA